MSSKGSLEDLSERSRSFEEGQHDLKVLHRQFREVLDSIQDAAPDVENALDDSEEDDDVEQTLYQSSMSSKQEIKLLTREIQSIQNDIRNIQEKLNSHRTTERNKVAKMNRQLDDLLQVLEGQLFRAQALSDNV